MKPNIRIRAMTSGDLDAVFALAARLEYAPHWSKADYACAMDPEASQKRLALVAETEAGQLAGMAIASLVPPQAEIENVAVAAAYQRQGIARALIGALAIHLHAQKVMEIYLEVRDSNLAAQALYRSLGFQDVGRRPGYYSSPPEDAVLMYLSGLPNTK